MESMNGGECWMICSFVIEANCQLLLRKGQWLAYSTYKTVTVSWFSSRLNFISTPLIKVKMIKN